MRVLVTRPALSGERTAEKLQARGQEALLVPLTEAVHELEATRSAVNTSTGAFAVTSGEAIRAVQGLGAELAPHLGRPVFAVGNATAEEAIEAGFTTVLHSNGDGARLADLIAANRALLGEKPLTYLAGHPRAAGFETRLSALSIEFKVFESYRMDPIQPPEEVLHRHLRGDPVDAILFYSRHNAALFFGLDEVKAELPFLKNIRLLCLSATIATIVPQSLDSMVEIAATPDEDSLLQLLDARKGPILI